MAKLTGWDTSVASHCTVCQRHGIWGVSAAMHTRTHAYVWLGAAHTIQT